MVQWRKREDRKSVRIGVRVRTDAGWIDATMRNVSSRGMMLQSRQPLRRNQFVEVAKGSWRMVGRVVWAKDAECGLQARDTVDLGDLLAPTGAGTAQQSCNPPNDRRVAPRAIDAASGPDLPDIAERSRVLGKALERMALVAAVACAAFLIGASVYDALAAPLGKIENALGARQVAPAAAA